MILTAGAVSAETRPINRNGFRCFMQVLTANISAGPLWNSTRANQTHGNICYLRETAWLYRQTCVNMSENNIQTYILMHKYAYFYMLHTQCGYAACVQYVFMQMFCTPWGTVCGERCLSCWIWHLFFLFFSFPALSLNIHQFCTFTKVSLTLRNRNGLRVLHNKHVIKALMLYFKMHNAQNRSQLKEATRRLFM